MPADSGVAPCGRVHSPFRRKPRCTLTFWTFWNRISEARISPKKTTIFKQKSFLPGCHLLSVSDTIVQNNANGIKISSFSIKVLENNIWGPKKCFDTVYLSPPPHHSTILQDIFYQWVMIWEDKFTVCWLSFETGISMKLLNARKLGFNTGPEICWVDFKISFQKGKKIQKSSKAEGNCNCWICLSFSWHSRELFFSFI